MVFEVVCSSVRSSWIFVLNSGSLSPNQGESNFLHTHRRHPHIKIALQLQPTTAAIQPTTSHGPREFATPPVRRPRRARADHQVQRVTVVTHQ